MKYITQNKTKAIQQFQQASDLGNTDAKFNLAVCYEKGDGVAQDKTKAIQLFQKASDLGNTSAMAQLEICYVEMLQEMEMKHC